MTGRLINVKILDALETKSLKERQKFHSTRGNFDKVHHALCTEEPNHFMLSPKELFLTIGQKASAQIAGSKYDIAIGGWLDKLFILTTSPKVKDGFLRAAPGTAVRVHYVKDGQVINFNSNTIATYANPPFMLIHFPLALEKGNLRKHDRYKAKIPITYLLGTTSNAATIFDISLGGALVAHPGPLVKDDNISISADISHLKVKLEGLKATVQNLRMHPSGISVSGVMFTEFSEPNRQALQKIIEFQAKESRV